MDGYAQPTPPGRGTGRGASFRPLVDRRQREDQRLQLSGPDREGLWTAVALAVDVVLAVLRARTSDGGAVSITLYDGDDRSRTYCSSPDELAAASEAIRDASEAQMIGGTRARTNAPRRRS